MKKRISTLIVAVLVLLAMVLQAVPAMAEEVPTLTGFLEECVSVEDFETNAATKWLEEKIGCNLDFNIAPVGSAEEKMNILLNSGDYPDIFYVTVPDENHYGIETGILLELTDYINPEDMPNLCYMFEQRPDVFNQMKAVDGKIYAFPQYAEGTHTKYPYKMFYNKHYMDELGLNVPTTTDELYDVLVAFKEAYPDGVGLTGTYLETYSFIVNAFTYVGTDSVTALRLHNGEVESFAVDEQYKEALRFMNKLCAEGLLDETIFTMEKAQVKALLASDTPVLFWGACNNVDVVDGANNAALYAVEKPLEPLMGPEGAQYSTYAQPAPTAGMAISAKCEHIDLAIKFADLHYSIEGFCTICGGIQGVDWKFCEEGVMNVLGTQATKERLTVATYDLQNNRWEPRRVCFVTADIDSSPFDPETYNEDDPASGGNFRSIMTVELYMPHYSEEYQSKPVYKFTSEENEEMSILSVSLENYIAKSRVEFITGNKDIDADWDNYVQGLYDIGLERVIEIEQAVYDRNSK